MSENRTKSFRTFVLSEFAANEIFMFKSKIQNPKSMAASLARRQCSSFSDSRMSPRRLYPPLWHDSHVTNEKMKLEREKETMEDLLARFSSRPAQRSFYALWRPTWVVGQEFSISCTLLAAHRLVMDYEEKIRRESTPVQASSLLLQSVSMAAVASTLLLVLWFSQRTAAGLKPVQDALLLAGILRLISSVLRTLTGSYSSDTVHALAVGGMLVHLLACDYTYANGGNGRTRASSTHITILEDSSFQGGTVSLNAALVSTTLLASRLSYDGTVYLFVSSAVILFCFYPAARHVLSQQYYHHEVTLLATLAFSVNTWPLLSSMREKVLFASILAVVCFLAPAWNCFYLQRHKVLLVGPWDIAHITTDA